MSTYPMSVNRIVEMILGSLVPIAVNFGLLSMGALIEFFFPSAMWLFLGISGIAILVLVLVTGLVFLANVLDIRNEGEPYD